MRLKKLELYGFKSFADRTEILFDEGMTGIVGPNGSGKSNIGDAVRWVLGEQNARLLRGAKMEDIIFSGSTGKKPLSWCEVSLTLDNSEGELRLPYSEICVTRRVFRSGESVYFINKKACRLKEIVELFRDTGIGRDGYSIIGQGQVAEIIDSRPEDRRDVFHESAGIMKHRVRKEEALKRLQNTEANLQRIDDIMNEMNLRLEPLKKQSESARRYVSLSEEGKKLELGHFVATCEGLTKRIENAQAQLTELQTEIEGQEAAILKVREEENLTQAETDRLDQVLSALQQEMTRTVAQEQKEKGEENVLLERAAALQERAQRLLEDTQQIRARVEEKKEQAQNSLEFSQDESKELQAQQQQLSALEKENAAFEEETEQAQNEADAYKMEAMERLNRMGNIRTNLMRLETLKEGAQKRLAAVQEGLNAQAHERDNIEHARGDIQREVERLETNRRDFMERNNARTRQLNELRAARQKALEQTGKLKEAYQSVNTRLNMLTAMKRDYEGFAEAVKHLLQDIRQKKAPDLVLGVVAEVIDVPQELVRAVEMALGSAMQNIITQTEEDSKGLIRHLRENRYGRATFLPLSAIKPRVLTAAERAVLRNPGCIGVASEKVTTEPRFESIISNLLGRTLIARDMDAAISMGRQCGHSLRIVTLEGDIINTGGSITGGSIQSRYTSLLARENEIAELKKKSLQIRSEGEKQAALAARLNEQVDSEKASYGEEEQEIHALDMILTREKERLDRAGQNGDRVQTEIRKLEEEAAQLTMTLEDIQQEHDRLSGQAESKDTDQQKLRDDMMALQQKVNRRREEGTRRMERLTALKAEYASREGRLMNAQAEYHRLTAEAEELEKTADKQAAERQELLLNGEYVQAQIAALRERSKDQQSAAEEIREKLKETEAARAELREQRASLMERLEKHRQTEATAKEQYNKTEMRQMQLQTELEHLHSRIWDRYEVTYANALDYRIENINLSAVGARISEIRDEIRKMGSVNVNAMEEYVALKSRYEEYERQCDDLRKAEDDLNGIIKELTQEMEQRFLERFQLINTRFGEIFSEMFGGGTAQLVLKDEEDVLSSGIDIKAQPPGTQLKMLSLLSGGEKALTAISLLFAFLSVNPSPFCILDEIEAALDDVNVKRFAQYITNFTRDTQFIVITHRKGTMESCQSLYGVTMEGKGVSKILSIKLSDYEEKEA